MKLIRALFCVGVVAILCGGCVVSARPEAHCAGGYWVEGHHGPHGRWHPGHWRCPGVVETVEVD